MGGPNINEKRGRETREREMGQDEMASNSRISVKTLNLETSPGSVWMKHNRPAAGSLQRAHRSTLLRACRWRRLFMLSLRHSVFKRKTQFPWDGDKVVDCMLV